MKALFALFFLVASFHLSSCHEDRDQNWLRVPECPWRLDVDNIDKLDYSKRWNYEKPELNRHTFCVDGCVEYLCSGMQKVKYGCHPHVCDDCPSLKKPACEDIDHHPSKSYCKKEDDGTLSYFFAGCKGIENYNLCLKSRDYATSYFTFMKECNDLQNGESRWSKGYHAYLPNDDVLCPSGEKSNDTDDIHVMHEGYCSACVEYQCGQRKVQFGCHENALQQCSLFREKVSADPFTTAYCKRVNGKISFYLPTCKGEPMNENCTSKAHVKEALEAFMGRCGQLTEGNDHARPIHFNLEATSAPPEEKIPAQIIQTTQTEALEPTQLETTNDALKTNAIGSFWVFAGAAILWFL